MFYDNEGAPVRKHYNLDEFGVDTTAAMGAAFKQSLLETFSSATWRDNELIRANIGEGEVRYGAYSPSLGTSKIITGTEKKLTTEQAQTQITESGLPLTVPEEGFTQKALDIVMERKREELVRKKQMDDASGLVATGGKFAAGMVAQVLDPVNIAASFVPVIGPTKYAAWIASATGAFERAAIRVGVGAVEGLTGAAIVEPAIYQAMTREQADYTMADSLINVGLGTVLGGGLHMGLGAASDAIKRTGSKTLQQPQGAMAKAVDSADPATRDAMLKTAMQMEAQGYKLDVTSVAAADPNLNAITKAMRQESEPVYSAATDRAAEIRQEIPELEKRAAPPKQKEMPIPKQMEKHSFTDRNGKKIAEIDAPAINKKSPSEMTVNQVEAEISMLDRVATDRANLIGKTFDTDSSNYMTQTSNEAARMHALKQNLMERGGEIQQQAKDRNAARRRIRALERELKSLDETPMPPHVDESQAMKNSVSEGFSPSNKRGVDKPASIEADNKLAKPERSLDDEMSDLEEFFSEYQKMTGDDTNLKLYDDAIAKAETDAEALKAATMCRLTK